MTDTHDIAFITGYIISAIVTGLIVYCTTSSSFKDEAVKLGFAEYDQTTGAWQWKGPCKHCEQSNVESEAK